MKKPVRNRGLRKKRYVIPAIIIAVLLIFRVMLPIFVKKYVNGVLANIPGYYGQVNDIDIWLIRGAYVINGLYLNKVDAGSEVPFLEFEKTDISIEWRSLIHGKIVSEIILTRPQLIYVFEDHQKNEAEKPDFDDWSKALTNLVPIDINHLKITEGKAAFLQLSADPDIDLDFHNIYVEATNLKNVVRTEKELPSTLDATAISVGNGQVSLTGKMDLVKAIPDMDLAFSIENMDATALNDFTNYYSGIDFARGNFSLYSEVAIADGFLTGYIKPILKDSKLIEKEDKFFEKLWEGFVGFFKFILKNHKNNTLATKVPIEGDLNKVEGKAWPAVFNIFKNAWIKAYKETTDNDIDFEDAENKAEKKHKD